ncbi:MAG: hypothetical protein WCG78_04100, partial [Candidatus Omnitrophota bacterium]
FDGCNRRERISRRPWSGRFFRWIAGERQRVRDANLTTDRRRFWTRPLVAATLGLGAGVLVFTVGILRESVTRLFIQPVRSIWRTDAEMREALAQRRELRRTGRTPPTSGSSGVSTFKEPGSALRFDEAQAITLDRTRITPVTTEMLRSRGPGQQRHFGLEAQALLQRAGSPAAGAGVTIEITDEFTGRFMVDRQAYFLGYMGEDGRLHIAVTRRFFEEKLMSGSYDAAAMLAEAIDHEFVEHIDAARRQVPPELRHRYAASRSRLFALDAQPVSECHRCIIDIMAGEGRLDAAVLGFETEIRRSGAGARARLVPAEVSTDAGVISAIGAYESGFLAYARARLKAAAVESIETLHARSTKIRPRRSFLQIMGASLVGAAAIFIPSALGNKELGNAIPVAAKAEVNLRSLLHFEPAPEMVMKDWYVDTPLVTIDSPGELLDAQIAIVNGQANEQRNRIALARAILAHEEEMNKGPSKAVSWVDIMKSRLECEQGFVQEIQHSITDLLVRQAKGGADQAQLWQEYKDCINRQIDAEISYIQGAMRVLDVELSIPKRATSQSTVDILNAERAKSLARIEQLKVQKELYGHLAALGSTLPLPTTFATGTGIIDVRKSLAAIENMEEPLTGERRVGAFKAAQECLRQLLDQERIVLVANIDLWKKQVERTRELLKKKAVSEADGLEADILEARKIVAQAEAAAIDVEQHAVTVEGLNTDEAIEAFRQQFGALSAMNDRIVSVREKMYQWAVALADKNKRAISQTDLRMARVTNEVVKLQRDNLGCNAVANEALLEAGLLPPHFYDDPIRTAGPLDPTSPLQGVRTASTLYRTLSDMGGFMMGKLDQHATVPLATPGGSLFPWNALLEVKIPGLPGKPIGDELVALQSQFATIDQQSDKQLRIGIEMHLKIAAGLREQMAIEKRLYEENNKALSWEAYADAFDIEAIAGTMETEARVMEAVLALRNAEGVDAVTAAKETYHKVIIDYIFSEHDRTKNRIAKRREMVANLERGNKATRTTANSPSMNLTLAEIAMLENRLEQLRGTYKYVFKRMQAGLEVEIPGREVALVDPLSELKAEDPRGIRLQAGLVGRLKVLERREDGTEVIHEKVGFKPGYSSVSLSVVNPDGIATPREVYSGITAKPGERRMVVRTRPITLSAALTGLGRHGGVDPDLVHAVEAGANATVHDLPLVNDPSAALSGRRFIDGIRGTVSIDGGKVAGKTPRVVSREQFRKVGLEDKFGTVVTLLATEGYIKEDGSVVEGFTDFHDDTWTALRDAGCSDEQITAIREILLTTPQINTVRVAKYVYTRKPCTFENDALPDLATTREDRRLPIGVIYIDVDPARATDVIQGAYWGPVEENGERDLGTTIRHGECVWYDAGPMIVEIKGEPTDPQEPTIDLRKPTAAELRRIMENIKPMREPVAPGNRPAALPRPVFEAARPARPAAPKPLWTPGLSGWLTGIGIIAGLAAGAAIGLRMMRSRALNQRQQRIIARAGRMMRDIRRAGQRNGLTADGIETLLIRLNAVRRQADGLGESDRGRIQGACDRIRQELIRRHDRLPGTVQAHRPSQPATTVVTPVTPRSPQPAAPAPAVTVSARPATTRTAQPAAPAPAAAPQPVNNAASAASQSVLRSVAVAEMPGIADAPFFARGARSQEAQKINRPPTSFVIGIPRERASVEMLEVVRARVRALGRTDCLVIPVDRFAMEEQLNELGLSRGVILDIDSVQNVDGLLGSCMEEIDIQGLFADYSELKTLGSAVTSYQSPVARETLVKIANDVRLLPRIASLGIAYIGALKDQVSAGQRIRAAESLGGRAEEKGPGCADSGRGNDAVIPENILPGKKRR